MKSFQQFITEASQELDDVKMAKRTDTPLKVGRIGANTKKSPAEKKRVKAVGGGKTAPAKNYKDRKDIGTNKPVSTVKQQPTKERGSASLSPREQQRKARAERIAKQKGAKTKTADQLLAKKVKKTVSPKYKPTKATGYTTPERQKITRAGERLVRDIAKGKEKPASSYDPGVRKG